MRPLQTIPLLFTLAAARKHQEPLHHRAAAHHPDAPQEVTISNIALSGTGCPPNYAPGDKLSDPTVLVVPAASFTAQSGGGQTATDGRTNCQILASVKYPAGWQFSVTKAEYAGYAKLPEGVTGTSKTTYYFSNSGEKDISSTKTLEGPYDDTYSRTDAFDDASTIWSDCGSSAWLNVNSEVRVSSLGTDVKAVIGVNTPANVGITWRKC